MERELFSRRAHDAHACGSLARHLFESGREEAEAHPELDVIDLSLGNPDLEPAAAVCSALRALVADKAKGLHRYMDNAGFPDVRDAVASHLSQESGIAILRDSVYLTCGAAGALQIVFGALLNPGDEVIVFAPYFPEYIGFIRNALAVPKVVRPGASFQLDLAAFEAALSTKTRAVVVNNPNNPAGVLYPAPTLARLASVLAAHRERTGYLVHVIADEAGCGLAHDGRRSASVLAAWDAVWLVRSCSKDASLAGERIGYLAWGPELSTPRTLPLLSATARSFGYASAPALMQRLLPHVLAHPLDASEYRLRCRRFVATLNAHGVDVVHPDAGFFAFPRSPIADERWFCQLLAKHGVLCVPGSAFGAPGYFRASLTQPVARVEEAALRIARWARLAVEARTA